MSEAEKDVTHEDIWDDSALVNSWNEALEEYKKYHSIHADRAAEATIVPDSQNPLLNAKTETNEPQSPPNRTRGDGETIQEQAKDRNLNISFRGPDGVVESPYPDGALEETDDGAKGPTGGRPEGLGMNDQQPGGTLSSPVSVLGSVKDESLKSLLMSWYYAGYYTGLYEGQQQRSRQGES